VLDMGEPVKISYLDEQLIKLSGKEDGSDIEIIFTGLRPGEKLFEELSYPDENMELTACDKVYVITGNNPVSLREVKDSIKKLAQGVNSLTHDEVSARLTVMVPESKILIKSKTTQKVEALV
jgi:FlaA1/EpsC-like NDP-sugar epimerase